MSKADVVADFSAQEKAAGKLFLAACEREFAKRMEDLQDDDHDDTDVFA